MTPNKINAVRSVAIGVPNVDASAKFYKEIWGLIPVAESPGAVYLRGTGRDHHVLALLEHHSPEVLCLDLMAPDRAAVDSLNAACRDAGLPRVEAPAAIAGPGAGYGFTLTDKEGRTVRVIADPIRHEDLGAQPDRPVKITHVVLNSADADMAAISKLYCEVLGFTVMNRIRMQSFLKCNEDHHTLAFALGETNTLNHIAFAMMDVDAVARGARRMMSHGYPIGWGVGQHNAGEDVYAYFEGPEGGAIEYIAKCPLGWDGASSGTPNWDVELRPNAKLAAAMRRIPFVGAAH